MKYNFDDAVSRLGTGAEKYEARNALFGKADVAPYWVADMDLPTPAFLRDALSQRLAHSMFGYTTVPASLLESIQWWQRTRHGAKLETDWIRLSPSVVTSIAMGIQAYSQPGDGVVVLSPVYGPFFFVTKHNGRRVIDQPLMLKEGQYLIDFDSLEACFKEKKPRILLLCNPHNPGGRVWSKSELDRLVTLCRRFGVHIFSDEIHCDIVYAPHRHTSLLTLPDALDICTVAHSIGKTFNTSGLNASFVVIPEKQNRKKFADAQEISHCGSVNLLGKIAMETAFSPEGETYRRALIAYLNDNICEVVTRLEAIGGATVMSPQATFLVWCDFRAFGKWPTVMKTLVHKANVALSGGTFFGPAGEGWFRMNCAHPREELLQAADRIVAVMSEL